MLSWDEDGIGGLRYDRLPAADLEEPERLALNVIEQGPDTLADFDGRRPLSSSRSRSCSIASLSTFESDSESIAVSRSDCCDSRALRRL